MSENWATVDDVKQYFQSLSFEDGQFINKERVEKMLSFAKGYMESGLRVSYQLPISDPDDVQTLARLQAKFVAGEIDQILYDAGKFTDNAKPRNLKEEAENELSALVSREKTLKSGVLCRVGYDVAAGCDCAIKPYFKRGKKF